MNSGHSGIRDGITSFSLPCTPSGVASHRWPSTDRWRHNQAPAAMWVFAHSNVELPHAWRYVPSCHATRCWPEPITEKEKIRHFFYINAAVITNLGRYKSHLVLQKKSHAVYMLSDDGVEECRVAARVLFVYVVLTLRQQQLQDFELSMKRWRNELEMITKTSNWKTIQDAIVVLPAVFNGVRPL